MATYEVEDGVSVETGGVVQVKVRATDPQLAADADPEEILLSEALAEAGFSLAARFDMRPHPDAGLASVPGARPEVRVRVEPGESAVLLVRDRNGLAAWAYGEEDAGATLGFDGTQTLVFPLARPSGLGIDFGRWRSRVFGWVMDRLKGTVETYVLKFVAGVAIDALLKKLEGDAVPGLVSLSGPSKTWTPGQAVGKPPPEKPVLLTCHGTFSSTIGTFAQLETEGPCRDFLDRARATYGAVLGFDHRTLAETPMENARAYCAALKPLLPQGATVDAIAFSRGALVYRTLETLLLEARPDVTLRRAVFVGCTNGGTTLAEPDNWETLADLYTNAILGAARAIGMATGGAVNPFTVLGIKLVGRFVQTVAQVGVTDRRAPGLAAMEPDGEVVRSLNGATSDPSRLAHYYAVSSNFEATLQWRNGLSELVQAALDRVTDDLIGPANDLVVHTPSMTQFGTRQPRLKDTFAIGAQEAIYHTVYFRQDVVGTRLKQWLLA